MSRGNFPGETQRQGVTFPIAVYVLGVSSRVANIHVFLQKWDVVRDCMRPASAAAVVGFLSGQVALQLHALRLLRLAPPLFVQFFSMLARSSAVVCTTSTGPGSSQPCSR